MAETTIEWTRGPTGEVGYTFNTHWGCTEISPGCDNCYARRLAARFGVGWGLEAERRVFDDRHWAEPEKWNRKAERTGTRPRVFTNSMSDWADNQAPDGTRERLFSLVERTPFLSWLLLTKRIGNARGMLPARWFEPGAWPAHVRIGATVVNQSEYDRDIGKLLRLDCPNFLSIEPMLGPIDLRMGGASAPDYAAHSPLPRSIEWVVAGGESGPKARPVHLSWVRSLRDQCAAAGVPFLWKQWGEWIPAGQPLVGGALHIGIREFGYDDEGRHRLHRLGKPKAGRLLDGVEHNGFPIAAA